jgi:hypothetical protein
MIKEYNTIKLANFDAGELILHNVSLPLVDIDTKLDALNLESYPILSDTTKLSSIFPDALKEDLHIVVDFPSGTLTYISVPNNS